MAPPSRIARSRHPSEQNFMGFPSWPCVADCAACALGGLPCSQHRGTRKPHANTVYRAAIVRLPVLPKFRGIAALEGLANADLIGRGLLIVCNSCPRPQRTIGPPPFSRT